MAAFPYRGEGAGWAGSNGPRTFTLKPLAARDVLRFPSAKNLQSFEHGK